MPRKRKDESKTSQTVHLEGENYVAVKTYHDFFTSKRQTSYSDTMNKIITQWAAKTPPLERGYKKP